MFNKQDKNKARQKRHLRVRNHISGTAERPRLNVFRSLSNIYAQVIDLMICPSASSLTFCAWIPPGYFSFNSPFAFSVLQ